jgi:hypothetical protein
MLVRKIYRTPLLLLLGFCLILDIYSQPKNVTIQGMGGIGFGLFVPMMGSESSRLEVLGTPYISDSWMYGSFTVSDSVRYEGLLRYNVFTQEMEFIYNSDTVLVTAPFRLSGINFSGKKFEHALYIEEKGKTEWLGSAYFEVLNSGTIALLRKNYVKIEENSFARNYMGGGGDGREYYVHKSALYFRNEPGTEAVKFEKRQRYLLRIMKKHEKEVLEFIRENKLNIRNEKDLILVFDFYNQLS